MKTILECKIPATELHKCWALKELSLELNLNVLLLANKILKVISREAVEIQYHQIFHLANSQIIFP